MANSILQSFLDNSFIKTDDPEHITNLNKASAVVQKLLKKKKTDIICYTLVALDPTISDNDPIIGDVEAIIIKQWPTFKNSVAKTKDTPIAYIQAVILDSLNKLSTDENLAAIVWHTGRNIVRYYKLAGREKVLHDFLLEIGAKVESVGRKNWTLLESASISNIEPFELTLPTVKQVKVDEAKLSEHLLAAANHSAWVAQGGGGENPSHTAVGNHTWPVFFAERAATGVTAEINAALNTQNKSIAEMATTIQESLRAYLTNLKPHLEQFSASIIQSSQSLKKRSDLIWWKQALYSSRLDSGYRSLKPLTLAVAMATDLADSVAPNYPKSVDYFLNETLRDVLGDKTDTEEAVVELLAQLQLLTDLEKQLLKDLNHGSDSRKSLGACMADLAGESIDIEEFFEHSGLEKKSKMSLGELTAWLFHDLQAIKLAKAK